MSAASVPSTPSAADVRLVTSATEFAALRGPWNEVAATCKGRSVFLEHEWFDAAWQWRQTTSRLYLLCLYRSQRLAAVLPLVVQAVKLRGVAVRELGFLTVPDTQWCDLIASASDAEEAAAAFASELGRRRREWDVLRLKYLGTESVADSALRAALAAQRFAVRRVEAPGNCYIPLHTNWAEFYATRSRRLKKANNLAANRLQRAGEIRIDWHAPGVPGAGTVDNIVEQVISISATSWKSETGTSLDNPGPQAFIRRLLDVATDRQWLSIWLLSLDGRPAAMEIQLIADGDVFGLRSDFDPALENVSPGSSLNRHMLEQLFGRGLHRYYMGPGNNAYKHRWTDQVERVGEMTAYGRSLTGRALAAWETALKPAAIRLRDRFARKKYEPAGSTDD